MLYQIRDENGNLILKDRVALVTGASGGIGGETARLLAHNGAAVAVHYNTKPDRALEVKKSILSRDGRAEIFPGNLTDSKAVDDLVAAVVAKFGHLDILVANAGIFPEDDVSADQMDQDRIRKVIDLTVVGNINCCAAFLRHLRCDPRPGANIVLVGSTSGEFGERGHVEYSAAKAALSGIKRTLANEIVEIVGDGRVNLVAPGWALTPMTDKFVEWLKGNRQALQTRSITRIGRSEDTARAILYLASPLASYVTKETLRVSGGMEGRVLWRPEQVNAIPSEKIF